MAVGLHYNDNDLTEWLARSNPAHPNYCVGTSTNQGWPNIAARALEFIANPSAQIYTGVTRAVTDYVRQGDTPMPNLNPNNYGRNTVQAAFVALVTNNSTYATAVRDFLFLQMAEPKTDFSNATHWNTAGSSVNTNGPFWGICEWLVRLLHAFDYIKDYLSAGDKSDIETWFYNAGQFFHTVLWNQQDALFASEADRSNGILANPAGGWGNPNTAYNYGGAQVYTHRNAALTKINPIYVGNTLVNNRTLSVAQFVGLAGVYFNESTWKNNAKYEVKNNIRLQLFSDGANAEMLRTTTDANTEQGWTYSASIWSYLSLITDAFYRDGNSELYSFLTADGFQSTVGGSKSLQLGWQGLYRFVNQTIVSGNPGYSERSTTNDAASLINGTSNTVRHAWCALSNMYYKDAELEEAYKLTYSGGYPASPDQGNVSYMMQGALLPDVLFMWGDREYSGELLTSTLNKKMLLSC